MRFTQRARQVLALTRDQAERLHHTHIGTEHLLMGLIQDDGTVGAVLRQFGVSLAQVQDRAQRMYLAQDYPAQPSLELALDLKIVLSAAVLEAQANHKTSLTATQLLITLLSQRACHAVEILEDLNIRPELIRQELQIASGGGPPAVRGYRLALSELPYTTLTELPNRLSGNAQRALRLAKDEAKQHGHPAVSSAHLLFGLISAEGQAQRVLTYLGLDRERVGEALQSLYSSKLGHNLNALQLSPDLEEVLILAENEGLPGENAIGTGHLLLGITLQPKSSALEILKDFGISAQSHSGANNS